MAELKYSLDGFWFEKVDGQVVVGLSEKGQDDLGEVSFIDLPATGDIKKDDTLIGVEAAKAVTELTLPLDATIVEVNEDLSDHPSQLNSQDRNDTWIVKLVDVDEAAFSQLNNESGLS